MARHAGVSRSTVSGIWRRNGPKPHGTRTFKLSKDKHFERKLCDVIGLCLDPPETAISLCCGEKTQCQALERTQPGLPLGIGHTPGRRRTTATVTGRSACSPAMSYLEGKLIYRTVRSRNTPTKNGCASLSRIRREVPKDLDVHMIADNCSTHKLAKVKAWLELHKRFHMCFTPIWSPWMNLVERLFADLTERCIRSGSFTSVKELTGAITTYLA